MALLLDTSVDTAGSFIAGDGSERQILVTADDFGTGAVTFELSRTLLEPPTPPIAPASNLDGTILSINTNRAINIGPIPVGMQIRARLAGSLGSASNVRADLF